MTPRFFLVAAFSIIASSCYGQDAAAFAVIEKSALLPGIAAVHPEASATLHYAEEELRRVLAQMGDEAKREGEERGEIRLVRYDELPESLRKAHPLLGGSTDEVLIVRDGSTLYLSGPTDRAVLYAVYTFLQDVAGVRWLWPGEDGERIPARGELVMKEAVIRHRPTLSYRALSFTGSNEFDLSLRVWGARNRLNIGVVTPWMKGISMEDALALHRKLGFRNRWAGHTVGLSKEVLAQHPEYIAEYSGVRRGFHSHSAHLCWSNPGVQEELMKAQQEIVLRYPEIDIISLYTTDHGQYCQCSACVEMASDVTTRWQLLSEKLVAAIKEVRPEVKVWTLAYDAYRPVPKAVAPYDNIEYTIYNASYRFPYSSGAAGNATALREMKRWQEKGAKVGIRNYEMIPFRGPGGYVPLVYFMSDQIRYAKANGLDSYNSEIGQLGLPVGSAPETRNWNWNRINAYALTQFAWDSEYSPEALVDDWCQAAYGPAAAPMKRYYQAMEEAWRKAPGDISGFHHTGARFMPGYITAALIDHVTPILQEAKALAGKANDRRAMEQVELEDRLFSEWRDLFFYAQMPATAHHFQACPLGAEGPRRRNVLANGESVAFEDAAEGVRMTWHGAASGEGQRIVRFLHPTEMTSGLEVQLDFDTKQATAYRYHAEGRGDQLTEERMKWEENEGRWTFTVQQEEIPRVSVPSESQRMVLLSRHGDNVRQLWPSNPQRPNGKLFFPPRELPRITFLEGDVEAPNPLHLVLSSLGWESQRSIKLDPAAADLVVVRSGEGRKRVSAEQVVGLKALLEAGGAALVIAEDTVALHQWLNDPKLALNRVREPHLRRSAVDIDPGDWALKPHRLIDWMRTGTTPLYGLRANDASRWQSLVSLPLKDGTSLPYLLRARIGRGTLYVTTERLGYGGGFTTFGDRNTPRVGNFVENLWQDHLSQQRQSGSATSARD